MQVFNWTLTYNKQAKVTVRSVRIGSTVIQTSEFEDGHGEVRIMFGDLSALIKRTARANVAVLLGDRLAGRTATALDAFTIAWLDSTPN
jgi:hypothetical protein